ncbi:NAD(P)/FAD-dependent oxidoreductase [Nocardioides caldifontis]|uniref:NAD(P)/FAD-dependent oxidoreductase n=1 Tax=Nocardioides caldifontis TaxID=2588938 RepID=UPI0011DFBBD9|nr:NAD(P)/FAD-dependent oxidoreductase [Nocardioides caldifontis]
MSEEHEVDLLVIGAGPVGLFAAYYAGFRGLSVAVVDSLPELGGQITAMYPEKEILDVAGFPSVKGKELVAGLVAQAATADPTYLLGRTARTLEDGGEEGPVRVGLDDGTTVVAKAVIITAGIGKFTPRPLPAAEGWTGGGVAFFVPSLAEYAGKDVVVVGGGDSAFDWALALQGIAASVTLVHRREAFRAHQATVDKVLAGDTEVITNANVARLVGDDGLEAVEIEHVKTGETTVVKAQAVIAALGFVADLGPIQEWGLEVHKRHIVVDSTTRTNLPRVFAAGDVTDYPGKVRLIAVGFGEAATAVNNAAVAINPAAHLFPGHSSEG